MRIRDASLSGFDGCHVREACLEQDRPWHRGHLHSRHEARRLSSLIVVTDVSGHVSRLV